MLSTYKKEISAKELENNFVAIKQLINEHNVNLKKNAKQQQEIIALKAKLTYQNKAFLITILITYMIFLMSILLVCYLLN